MAGQVRTAAVRPCSGRRRSNIAVRHSAAWLRCHSLDAVLGKSCGGAVSRRRILLVGALPGLAVAAAARSPGGRWRLSALWRREAFYQGRPTSYWRRQILDYPDDMAARSPDLPPSMSRYQVYPPESRVGGLRDERDERGRDS
jgi:hypothetical protein